MHGAHRLWSRLRPSRARASACKALAAEAAGRQAGHGLEDACEDAKLLSASRCVKSAVWQQRADGSSPE